MKNLGRPLRRTEPQLKPRSLVELLSRLLGGDCQEVLHMGSINPPKKRDYGKNTRIDVSSLLSASEQMECGLAMTTRLMMNTHYKFMTPLHKFMTPLRPRTVVRCGFAVMLCRMMFVMIKSSVDPHDREKLVCWSGRLTSATALIAHQALRS